LLECNINDFLNSYERVIYHLDSPVADPSVVAIYLISKEAARHVKVVLSGEGSDEMFAGYRIYDSSRAADKISNLPCILKSPLKLIQKIMPNGMKGKQLLERGLVPVEERFVGNSFVFSEKEKKDFLKTFDSDVCYTDRTKHIYQKTDGYSSVMKMQYCDFNTWLPSDILVKGDRLSMANALEVRVPFLDKKVYSVARELCDGDKLRDNTTKFILRDAFRDILNAETIVRPKLGYPVPVRVWLKDELYDWAREKILTECAEEYIDKNGALKLLEEHRTGKRDLYHEIWSILVFNTWYKMYISDREQTIKKINSGDL
jgi:asparagine synthase (glutamine-hydrolysing)